MKKFGLKKVSKMELEKNTGLKFYSILVSLTTKFYSVLASPTTKFYSILMSSTTKFVLSFGAQTIPLEGHTWLSGYVVQVSCSADVELSRTGDFQATTQFEIECRCGGQGVTKSLRQFLNVAGQNLNMEKIIKFL